MFTEPKCRFLTNTYNPYLPNAEMYLVYSFHAMDCGKVGCDREWQHHLEYIESHIMGRPKATEKYTRQQLADEGMVGIYMPPDADPVDKSHGVGCISCKEPRGPSCEGCTNIEDVRLIYSYLFI